MAKSEVKYVVHYHDYVGGRSRRKTYKTLAYAQGDLEAFEQDARRYLESKGCSGTEIAREMKRFYIEKVETRTTVLPKRR